MDFSMTAIRSALITDVVLRPVSWNPGSRLLKTTQVCRDGCGELEKIPTIVRSSPWVARTTAGLTFVVVRSVKGNLTRTTSPGWAIVGIKVWLGQPFLEPELPQPHPLSNLTPFRDGCQDYFKLLGRKLTEQLGELLRGDLNHQLDVSHESLLDAESNRSRKTCFR